jgi:hypothetical protein
MKLETSLRNAQRIADRLHNLGGIVGTPDAEHVAFRIKRVWLFGSTVKGKLNPNDTDILIEGFEVGEPRRYGTGGRLDKRYSYSGLKWVVSSKEEAYKTLRGKLKMVRLHPYEIDGTFEDIPQTKVLIYPRNDLNLSSNNV